MSLCRFYSIVVGFVKKTAHEVKECFPSFIPLESHKGELSANRLGLVTFGLVRLGFVRLAQVKLG